MKMHGVGLIQLNSPDGELEMTDPTRHWSDSPLGELEVVHPTRPMASWIGRPSLPLGELDVGRPTRPMANWTWVIQLARWWVGQCWFGCSDAWKLSVRGIE